MICKNNSKTKTVSLLILLILTFFLIPAQNLLAEEGDHKRDRFRTCDPEGNPLGSPEATVDIEGFDELIGKDIEIEASNTYCATRIWAYYISFKGALSTMNVKCGSGGVSVTPSPVSDAIDIAVATYKQTQSPNPACQAAYTIVMNMWAVILADLGITYELAKYAFSRTRICGSNWMEHDSTTMLKDKKGRYQNVLKAWFENPANADKHNFEHKQYRELYYGGMERTDPTCLDVNRKNDDGTFPKQRYYFRGTNPAIYNCEQYNVRQTKEWNDPLVAGDEKGLSPSRVQQYKEAYDCCISRKSNTICIESKGLPAGGIDESDGAADDGYRYKLCDGGGQHCTIRGVEFKANTKYNGSMICAETYSLCPYNFNVGGGALACDWFEDGIDGEMIDQQSIKDEDCTDKSEIRNGSCEINGRAGKCSNYCQVLEHCVVVDANNYSYDTDITSPYFSSACLDFVGDSKNKRGFDSGFIGGGIQNHFSAPIAQCVRETVENIFLNQAGHTKCKNALEIPDKKGNCFTPLYNYKKGEVMDEGNFFAKLQKQLRLTIQMVLTMSILFTGVKVLAGDQGALRKKELMLYIAKLGLVVYFVTGQAWQSAFFNGIYKASEAASNIVFKITVKEDLKYRDGCQFGDITKVSADGNLITTAATDPYPEGKEYLAIWDTMDCKIARYLGMTGSNTSTSNLAKIIIAGMFTGTPGVWFATFFAIFGILMVIATVQMLHIFLASAISIIILVYVSLITIPMVLFKKTKEMFDKWLDNLISLSVQPIILFAYVGMYVAIFDHIAIGSATFEGDAPTKTVVCTAKCYDLSGTEKTPPQNETVEEICDVARGDVLITPATDSVACIVTGEGVGNWPGLEIIGITIPVLRDIFSNDGRKKLAAQITTILKAALSIFILSSFVGQIPSLATALVGGTAMKMAQIDPAQAVKKIAGAVDGVAKRARRGGAKYVQSHKKKRSQHRQKMAKKDQKAIDADVKMRKDAMEASSPKDTETN